MTLLRKESNKFQDMFFFLCVCVCILMKPVFLFLPVQARINHGPISI